MPLPTQRIAFLVLCLFAVAAPVPAQDKAETKTSDAIDPFDIKFKRPESAPAKGEDLETVTLAKLIDFKATVTKNTVQRGEVIKVTIIGILKEGFYTYPVTQRTKDMSDPVLTKIRYAPTELVTPLFPIEESDPVPYLASKKYSYVVHKKSVQWSQDLLIRTDAPTGKQTLKVKVNLQICNDKTCYGPGNYPDIEIPLEVQEGKGVTPPENLTARTQPPASRIVTGAAPGSPGNTLVDDAPPRDLWGLLVAAFVGGFLMVLTPCVFPMIPITVNFFIKQSEKEHHQPLFLATIYSGTIIILLTLTVVAFGGLVVELAENPWFNLVLGGVMVFFALSLFGMYEIELPSFLARFTSAREGQGGVGGAFFMALTFTITSFTCTGPFLGIMLAPYAALQPPFFHRLLSALVYSTTFAAPFFFLALFPTLLRKLPKSGGWMNAIKVTMGFIELAAALKFLANTDYLLFPGRPRLFTYDAVLCSWIAISFAAGLYLIGLFRLPHDDAQEHVGVVRMIFGTIFFGLTLYMLPLLFGGKPTGMVGEGLQAFLPPRLSSPSGGFAGGDKKGAGEHLNWHQDYETAWKEAVEKDKLLFIDFTGVLCTNCRANEENVFPLPPVIEELKKYVRVQLYTDRVPDTKLSASESVEIAQQNKRWRNTLVKSSALPYYVILKPDPSKAYEGDVLLGQVIDTRRDLIRDENDFVQFLKKPQERNVADGSSVLGRDLRLESA